MRSRHAVTIQRGSMLWNLLSEYLILVRNHKFHFGSYFHMRVDHIFTPIGCPPLRIAISLLHYELSLWSLNLALFEPWLLIVHYAIFRIWPCIIPYLLSTFAAITLMLISSLRCGAMVFRIFQQFDGFILRTPFGERVHFSYTACCLVFSILQGHNSCKDSSHTFIWE